MATQTQTQNIDRVPVTNNLTVHAVAEIERLKVELGLSTKQDVVETAIRQLAEKYPAKSQGK